MFALALPRAPRRGQTATEYALVLMLIALFAIAILVSLGNNTASSFEGVEDTISASGGSGSGNPGVAFSYFPPLPNVGETVSFDGPALASSFDWDFGDGSAHDFTEDPTHTYASADSYTVTLTTNYGTAVLGIEISPTQLTPDYFLFSANGSYTDNPAIGMIDGDDVTYDIIRMRGAGGTIYAAWNSPVNLSSYTIKQGFAPGDPNYGLTALVQGGWRVYYSDDNPAMDANVGSGQTWTEVENAEPYEAIAITTHNLPDVGAHKRWKWVSTTQDADGSLQIDWVVRSLELFGSE